MKKTKNTVLVQELIRRGVSRHNAYRIVNESKGQAACLLVILLQEYLKLKASQEPT